MKYAILGDIHANLEALQAVLKDAEENGVTHYACTGDVVGYNADPKACLQMIKFGMSSTLITFIDGNLEVEQKGLTIGGYESAWLVDLAIAYFLEGISPLEPYNQLQFFGIGLGIFEGELTLQQLIEWLDSFQAQVNEITGNKTSSVSQPSSGN